MSWKEENKGIRFLMDAENFYEVMERASQKWEERKRKGLPCGQRVSAEDDFNFFIFRESIFLFLAKEIEIEKDNNDGH